jgi:hypothetical protein
VARRTFFMEKLSTTSPKLQNIMAFSPSLGREWTKKNVGPHIFHAAQFFSFPWSSVLFLILSECFPGLLQFARVVEPAPFTC